MSRYLLTCWLVLMFASVLGCFMVGDTVLVVGVNVDACCINNCGSAVS